MSLIPQADGSCQLEVLAGREEGAMRMSNRCIRFRILRYFCSKYF
jgi:hypothetical protein